MQITSNEIAKLVNELNVYRNAYYNENKSLISDKEYDELFDKLQEMESESGIIYANSPTQTVGYEVVSKLDKVKHDHPLLSLGKTTEMQEFIDYFQNKPTVLMAKMDGLTCSLYYENGELVSGESRGNGEIGEDITSNVKTFINIPLHIPYKGKLWVDGEAIISYNDFDSINEEIRNECQVIAKTKGLSYDETQKLIKDKTYKNPRNLVSGSVRQLNSEIAAKRKIRFIAWKLYKAEDTDGKREFNSNALNFKLLDGIGFEVVPLLYCDKFAQQCEMSINTIKGICEEKHYPIDGMVGVFDDIQYGVNLGMTGHHPKHSLSFKFYQERNETELIDIEWSTSRTGLINPVAIVEPVEIDGTTVSRATLNNVSIIKDLKLGIGDTVTIIKSNQIIPKIMENLTQSNTYKIPSVCPCCGSPAVIKNDNGRETLNCTNENCLARLHDKMSNFCSREGMNIVGLSEERLKTLMKLGFITDFESVYNVYKHSKDIEQLEGFGKSSVSKLVDAIEASKKCKLSAILTAIGIPGVGKSGAKSLAKHCVAHKDGNVFRTFINMACSGYDWSQLEDFGDITSSNINSFIIKNKTTIEPLIDILDIAENDDNVVSENKLGGKSFCITGKLIHFSNRDALVEEIEKYGGKIVSGVTAKTNYLITNDKDSGSSKNKKAEKYGTQIISEEEFIKLCK